MWFWHKIKNYPKMFIPHFDHFYGPPLLSFLVNRKLGSANDDSGCHKIISMKILCNEIVAVNIIITEETVKPIFILKTFVSKWKFLQISVFSIHFRYFVPPFWVGEIGKAVKPLFSRIRGGKWVMRAIFTPKSEAEGVKQPQRPNFPPRTQWK